MAEEERGFEEQPDLNAETKDSWSEVGQQFARLGESIATAFESAWKDESTQEYVQQMREGVEKMAGAVSKAVDDAASSPEGQKFRAEAEKAATSAKEASQEAVEKVRPQLLSALEQLNAKLGEMIDQMRESQAGESAEAEDAEETVAGASELDDASQVW